MRARPPRWPSILALAAATSTALLLGAALADAGRTTTGRLLLVAIVAFFALIAAGGVWALAYRKSRTDPLIERAETASKLAHELKNPLMAIKGLASTGVRLFDQMDDDERREFFRLIDEETGRLKRVVDQSATALKVDAERVVYDVREEDLGALVEEIAWDTPHGQHPMTVETQPGVTVRVDRRHFTEAFSNVVDNAARFSPPDAPIEVRSGQEDARAVIEVADRGPGIPSDRAEEVFERFGRWRPAGYEETPGAGLGLFLARAHVEAQGGRVRVVQRDDGGTILRITLPRGS